MATAVCPIKNPPPMLVTTATAVASPSQPKHATDAMRGASPGTFVRAAISQRGTMSLLWDPHLLRKLRDHTLARSPFKT